MLESMTEDQVKEFARWFVDEFYPKVDWWRSWIGYHEDAKLFEGLEITWGCAQGSDTQYVLRHPRNPSIFIVVTLAEVEHMDTSALIRLYWVRQMWIA
jgi:hypothetical protein